MRVLAAILAGLAVVVWMAPAGGLVRLRHLSARNRCVRRGNRSRPDSPSGLEVVHDTRQQSVATSRSTSRGWAARRLLASSVAGLGAGVVTSGWMSLLVGCMVALATHYWLGRMPSEEERRHRERMIAQLPLAVELLAAQLRAGRSPMQSLETVARAVSEPLGPELALVAASLRVGSTSTAAWSRFLDDPALSRLGRAMIRAWESGSPLASSLERLADDARRLRRAEAERFARSIGVRAAAPLGLCFLPAFIVLGVVPLIASMATTVLP